MKLKTIIIISLSLTLILLVGVIAYQSQQEDNDFFEENNIIDTVPIGRDTDNNWIYQTADNKIFKTKRFPTTPEGIEYAELVGRSD